MASTSISSDFFSGNLFFSTPIHKLAANPPNKFVIRCARHNKDIDKIAFSPPSHKSHEQYCQAIKEVQKWLHKSCNLGNYDEAFYYIQRRVKLGYKPDVIVCTRLIQGFFEEKRVQDALQVMECLQEHGEPSLLAYTALISGLCNMNRIDSAYEALSTRRGSGCLPDVVLYNILLERVLDDGKWVQGEKVVINMFSSGVEPNVATFTILLCALCHHGHLGEAVKLFKVMMDEGFALDKYICQILFSAFCREEKIRLDVAFAILDYMISCGCYPDITNYNVTLKELCRKDHAVEALELMSKLAETGCPLDVISYTTMVNAVWKSGDKARAMSLISDMISNGIDPDEKLYSSLISCLCREGMVDKAVELLEDIKNSEIVPTVITYNKVIHGLCQAHRIDDVIEILEEMVILGCKPNENTYVLIVEGIGFGGWRSEAMELARTLHEKRVISSQSLASLKRTFVNDDSEDLRS